MPTRHRVRRRSSAGSSGSVLVHLGESRSSRPRGLEDPGVRTPERPVAAHVFHVIAAEFVPVGMLRRSVTGGR
jgi:hypothetical protein